MTGTKHTGLVPYRCGSALIAALGTFYVASAISALPGFVNVDIHRLAFGLVLVGLVALGLGMIISRKWILHALDLRADDGEPTREDVWTLAIGIVATWQVADMTAYLFRLIPSWFLEWPHDWWSESATLLFLTANIILLFKARAVATSRLRQVAGRPRRPLTGS